MEAATKRQIKPGREYDYLFPQAMNKDKTVLENATLEDTIDFIHKVVRKTLSHTKGIAAKLEGKTVYETCRNIWYFVYENVAYKKDDDGMEQIRSPRRTWRDRKTGVDCDCYSTFISSILTNLGIPHKLRITKYQRDNFQHIYPVVPDGGRMIIIDCVTDKFDYEVPYSAKKDITMDLQYLDGLQGAGLGERGNDLVFEGSGGGMGELGKGFFKKLVSKINKLNPVTVVLRNGFLAAMKLNMFKVASRLKYAYLSPEAATKRGILKDKYDKLVKVRQKLESIFETAGGNPKNLKKAILNGKGNKNKEVVAGLGFLGPDDAVMYMNLNTPLAQLLGPEIYYDENVRGMEGFQGLGNFGGTGSLGELGVAPFIAAAAAAVGAIAKMLKGVGNIFGGGEKGSEDFSESETAAADKEVAQTPAAANATAAALTPAAVTAATESSPAPVTESSTETASTSQSSAAEAAPASSTAIQQATSAAIATASEAATAPATQEGFWQKNKKWLLPTVIGVGGIAVIAIGMKMMKPAGHSGGNLSGTPIRKNHHRGKPHHKRKQHKRKTAVALL